MNTKFRS